MNTNNNPSKIIIKFNYNNIEYKYSYKNIESIPYKYHNDIIYLECSNCNLKSLPYFP